MANILWIAVDRHVEQFLGCVLGSRGTGTGGNWETIAPGAERTEG